MKKRPFFLLSALALVAGLLITVAMQSANIRAGLAKPPGYFSPIIALEFAQDTPLIRAVFKLPEADKQALADRLKAIDRGTNLDYLFILTYASFMVFFALQCKKMGQQYPWIALVFGLLAALADVQENGQLKQIFSLVTVDQANFSAIFDPLRFWTALKFFSTGAFFLALAPFFWKANGLGKGVVSTAAAAIVCWTLACFYTPETWADLLFGMTFLTFVGAMVFGLTYQVKAGPKPRLLDILTLDTRHDPASA